MARLVVAGYLVRSPLGGYAWQAAHYLLGLRALGHDVWFYEDTGHYAQAYDPEADTLGPFYTYGLRAAARFLEHLGLGERWVFVDVERGTEHGPGAGLAATILREADLLVNVAGINRIPPERRGGRPAAYVDIDPGVTQIKADTGDRVLRAILDEHQHHFTIGENIGTARSPLPTAGYRWRPTRVPVAIEHWAAAPTPGTAYRTIGTWDAAGKDVVWRGERYGWTKREEWERFLDLPARAGCAFELAMAPATADAARLRRHGWTIRDPRAVSTDPWTYRDWIREARGEFTAAKDLNVRLRSAWFSDRAACFLAAGRPVVEQDTGFGDVLPLGPGLHAVRDVAEAAAAVAAIEADYPAARAHAATVARECFAADRVLAALLRAVGL